MSTFKISEDIHDGKYFLYRHIRKDKNEPFYIGVGTKTNNKTFEKIYKRAYSHKSRNRLWKSIVNRSNFEVEILFVSDDMVNIKNKEKEFISIYGRIDKKTGSLANFTDGGDGHLNPANEIWESRKKTMIESGQYQKMIERIKLHRSSYEKFGGINSKARSEVYVYNIDGIFFKKYDLLKDCINDLGIKLTTYQKYKNSYNNCKNYFFFNTDQGEILNNNLLKINLNRKKLTGSINASKRKSLGHPPKMPVRVINNRTKEVFVFESLKDWCAEFGIDIRNATAYAKKCKYKYFSIEKIKDSGN